MALKISLLKRRNANILFTSFQTELFYFTV